MHVSPWSSQIAKRGWIDGFQQDARKSAILRFKQYYMIIRFGGVIFALLSDPVL